MWSFLAEFTKNLDSVYTVVVMDEHGVDQPRRYEVPPRHVLAVWGGMMVLASLLMAGVLAFTPLREWIPGYGTEHIRRTARLNNLRVRALSDSLRAQQQYIRHLRGLITGRFDSTLVSDTEASLDAALIPTRPADEAPAQMSSADWSDHRQPALPLSMMPAQAMPAAGTPVRQVALVGLELPMRPPVEGFPTRGFDARDGHYAVDIAVEAGTPVRSVGGGYVIFADWTQSGGYTIAVQHGNGFTSVYKHNERLLKRVGDRVQSRETIAVSGNTGEITTGPHLHFEFWRNGLAQDPRQYFVGW